MLKSLELTGFKSFADRTRFEFHPGITAIVGPNGSGKSNVVDAVKWILGDQSAKSLRGKEMTDVIFNGATGRKPAGMAEATLTIDNASGFLPTESAEVQIGRRISRGGDAEYLVNSSTARLKDVRELFLGTGAGASTYAIIEQGRVDQILQSNATNRRLVFEEAAGISRYKARKAEALRKLERVEQNLLRLTDIVDEVEAQLNSTRSQAAKAAKYREVSQELRELWLGLAADEHRHLSASLREVEQSAADHEAQITAVNTQIAQQESRLAALDVEIAEVDDRLREVEKRRAATRETIAGEEATIRHQTARRRELDSELGRLRRQKSKLAARAREAVAEREHNTQVLQGLQEDYSRLQEKRSARQDQIRQLTDRLAAEEQAAGERAERLLDRKREVADIGRRAAALESRQAEAAKNRRQAEWRRHELDELIAACSAEAERRGAAAHAAAKRAAAADRKLRELGQRRETLLSKHSEFQKRLAEQREQRSGWQARKSLLQDLENRQEGLGIGVKEILKRAQTSDQPPWNSIRGSVADLLTVDLEHAALLEVAIGERSQLIVVEEYAPLVEYLGGGRYLISGRVGFVAPGGPSVQWAESQEQRAESREQDCVKPPSAALGSRHSALSASDPQTSSLKFDHPRVDLDSLPDLSRHPGVLVRADRLVQSSPEAAGLAERLLADTWIVETLQIALQLSAGDGRGCRFVTRQGELLETDGTIVVGTVRSESAIVSRKSELRSLKTKLLKLQRRIQREEKRLAGLDDALAEADAELKSFKAEHQQALKVQSAREAELAEQQRELERLNRDREAAIADAAESAQQERLCGEELQQSQLELAAAEEDLRTLEADNQRVERELAQHAQRRSSLQQRLAAEQLELAKSEERLRNLRDTLSRLGADLSQRKQQHQEAERRLELVSSKARQITLHILNARAELSELLLADERAAENAATLLNQKNLLRGRRKEQAAEVDALRQQCRQLSDARHEEEIQLRDIRHRMTTFVDRIEEEYQVDLNEVVESGVSAYCQYLEQRRGETVADDTPPLGETGDTADDPENRDDSDDSGAAADRAVDGLPADAAAAKSDADQPEHADRSGIAEGRENRSWDAPADDVFAFEEIREELEAGVDRLRRRLKLMGSVNTDSLSDLDDLEERHKHLSEQLADLVEAKNALVEIIRRINSESKRIFVDTFESIRGHFQDLFRRLFGGGEADVVLEDAGDVLECGIDVVARPPGKELRSLSLLSGGEKTMTAVALLLAMFKSRPSPFCILDEVDASLDEANLNRFVSLLKEFRNSAQFIMITHRKPSMTQADVLYGVTMEQSGVSKRMTVRFEDVGEDGSFRAGSPAAATLTNTQDGKRNAAA